LYALDAAAAPLPRSLQNFQSVEPWSRALQCLPKRPKDALSAWALITLDQVQAMMRPITAAADEWRQIAEDRRQEIESLREDHRLELQALREENRQLRKELPNDSNARAGSSGCLDSDSVRQGQ